MSWIYRRLIRPALFTQDAETIHEFTLRALTSVSRSRFLCEATQSVLGASELPVEAFGLRFPNPVGLAAGMDKDAKAVPAWAAMGFGFSELGGVTWLAQPGNPRPRIFRAISEEAIVNRMGFNNEGAEAMAQTLSAWRKSGRWPRHPVGINLGKSKVAPLDKAAEDYANSFRALRLLADFFVVNVSSPNTPNLRQLQDKAALDEILAAIQAQQTQDTTRKPILVKVAPDLTFEALDEVLELAEKRKLAGIVATNTTVTRPRATSVEVRQIYSEAGGLSGHPLRMRSTQIIRHLYRQCSGRVPIIGVGGISSVDDAWEKICAGATLVQLYSGLVFHGPLLPATITRGLIGRLGEFGLKDLSSAVGIGEAD